MSTTAARHLRPRSPEVGQLRQSVRIRRGGLAVTGAAVAVPGGVAGAFSPAQASPPAAVAPAALTAVKAQPQSTTTPVLRYGARGPAVERVQRALGGLRVDGTFGPATQAAVRSYQARQGLVIDGIVGPRTWARLGAAAENDDSCTPRVVRYGQQGALVATVQRHLQLRADGDFGPTTLSAVRSFQARNGLAVDGVVGPRTWRALGGHDCAAPAPSERPSSSSATGADALAVAQRYLGVRYVWGGSTPAGFDCSGLVQYVFRELGVSLPRTSLQQSRLSPSVPLDRLRVGDLVFFHHPVSHVAIYAGHGTILDAARPGTRISVHAMTNTPVRAVRLLPTG